MIYFNIFLVFFKIGLFAIGGAYSFLPLIEKEVVERYSWLSKKEFLDVLAMVKIFPGAISIKYATYTGYKIGGVFGAILANLGSICAPALMMFFASMLYVQYKQLPQAENAFNTVQLAVFAMIIAVAFQVINLNQLRQLRSLIIVLASFILFTYTKVHPVFIIIGAAILGIISK